MNYFNNLNLTSYVIYFHFDDHFNSWSFTIHYCHYLYYEYPTYFDFYSIDFVQLLKININYYVKVVVIIAFMLDYAFIVIIHNLLIIFLNMFILKYFYRHLLPLRFTFSQYM